MGKRRVAVRVYLSFSEEKYQRKKCYGTVLQRGVFFVKAVFADLAKPEITMITKGGFRTISYPWFITE